LRIRLLVPVRSTLSRAQRIVAYLTPQEISLLAEVDGNPKALQHHLGHSSPVMVMRYLSTLTQEDSLRIQQQVEFEER